MNQLWDVLLIYLIRTIIQEDYLSTGAKALATLLWVGRPNTLQMNCPASSNFSKSMPLERPIPCLQKRKVPNKEQKDV